MQEHYVDSPQQLLDLCARLRDSAWLALDTEFMREKTYYAQFCLLQVANKDLIACVDPIGLDLAPLLELIYNPAIVKVMHAGRQDLELFYDLRQTLPRPVFDTQLAATVLGQGEQIGYAALVQDILGVQLSKLHTRTDWSQRPLDPEQLHYAADDVRYLGAIYLAQQRALQDKGRQSWLQDDFAELTDEKNYVNSPLNAWQRVRQTSVLKGVQLAVLRALTAWREERAKAVNRPRKWIVSDEVLVDLAKRMPETEEQLSKLRGLEAQTIKSHGATLLELIRAAQALPREQWPQLPACNRVDASQDALVDALMAVVRIRSAQNAVSTATLATRKDLEALVLGHADTVVLHGWRAGLVGHDLQSFLEGRLALKAQDGKLQVCPAEI
jgi:ribonuclease D